MNRAKRSEYRRKYRSEHKEWYREYMRKRRAEHKEVFNERMRKYQAQDLNCYGMKKSNIRIHSQRYLFDKHSKIPEYEIHHAFGYDDYRKFIYIPKYLHREIHKLLRSRKIPADSDHWNAIRDIVNSCEEYTYISC